jgi:hypothetical protein
MSAEAANRGLVGASFNVNTNTGEATFTTKLQSSALAKADNVNVTFHAGLRRSVSLSCS